MPLGLAKMTCGDAINARESVYMIEKMRKGRGGSRAELETEKEVICKKNKY